MFTARIKSIAIITVSITGLALTSPAFAGDCKNVTFKLDNKHSSKVKVKNIGIRGNDGSWTENIGNKEINTNGSHTTGKQDLQKLDSGKKGDFTVNYELWDSANARWMDRSKTFSDRMCNDNKRFDFDLS